MDAEFSIPIREFIDKHIHSVAQLEVLLALHKNAGASWSVEQITDHFYLQPQKASELLRDLVHRGFVVQKGADFRLNQGDVSLRGLIEDLDRLYRERRVAVIARIFSKPE